MLYLGGEKGMHEKLILDQQPDSCKLESGGGEGFDSEVGIIKPPLPRRENQCNSPPPVPFFPCPCLGPSPSPSSTDKMLLSVVNQPQ